MLGDFFEEEENMSIFVDIKRHLRGVDFNVFIKKSLYGFVVNFFFWWTDC